MDFERVRADFPILSREVHGQPLVYLDNSATSHKPTAVLDAMDRYYQRANSNVHRGLHQLSADATDLYEGARDTLVRFLNVPGREGVIFSRGATSAINLVARSLEDRLKPGDVIVTTELEHHANLVSWQITCRRTGAHLRFIPIDDGGNLDLSELDTLIDEDVKVVAAAHISNVLGGVNDVAPLIARAKAVGALSLIDGAQSVGHMPVDFQALGCDFLVFSSHKMCGPTGIGCLIGRPEVLDTLEPVEGGGDMIVHVDWHESSWNRLPYKFEAGTPSIAEAIGLGAACDYLSAIGLQAIADHTQALTERCAAALDAMDGVNVVGPLTNRMGPVAFTLDGVHPHDIATLLDGVGVAVRAGHHCAQPLHARLGLPATARASFYLTNRDSEIDALVAGIHSVQKVFAPCSTTSTRRSSLTTTAARRTPG